MAKNKLHLLLKLENEKEETLRMSRLLFQAQLKTAQSFTLK